MSDPLSPVENAQNVTPAHQLHPSGTVPPLPAVAQPELILNEDRRGSASNFTPAEDLILIREVAAAKAHIAGHGEKGKRFQVAADKANGNPNLRDKVPWKSVQDRYKQIDDLYSKADERKQKASGFGGALDEMEEILSITREANREKLTEEKACKPAQTGWGYGQLREVSA